MFKVILKENGQKKHHVNLLFHDNPCALCIFKNIFCLCSTLSSHKDLNDALVKF